jgi:hypothetical protein
MNTVVNFLEFRERGRNVPTLVLVDLHHDLLGGAEMLANRMPAEAIANCRMALRHARACGIPVAFTRQVAPSVSMLASPVYPRWIEGFEPKRWDMVFDRQRPSCYASAEWRQLRRSRSVRRIVLFVDGGRRFASGPSPHLSHRCVGEPLPRGGFSGSDAEGPATHPFPLRGGRKD